MRTKREVVKFTDYLLDHFLQIHRKTGTAYHQARYLFQPTKEHKKSIIHLSVFLDSAQARVFHLINEVREGVQKSFLLGTQHPYLFSASTGTSDLITTLHKKQND